MVLISEWLPDPEGSDAEGEWIELVNLGKETVDLSGWSVSNGARNATLSGTIRPGEYVVITRRTFRFPLVNSDGHLVLKDQRGSTVDEVSFVGGAPEGKSVAREKGDSVLFLVPTPRGPNGLRATENVLHTTHPYDIPINDVPGVWGSWGAFFVTAVLLTRLTLTIKDKQ